MFFFNFYKKHKKHFLHLWPVLELPVQTGVRLVARRQIQMIVRRPVLELLVQTASYLKTMQNDYLKLQKHFYLFIIIINITATEILPHRDLVHVTVSLPNYELQTSLLKRSETN